MEFIIDPKITIQLRLVYSVGLVLRISHGIPWWQKYLEFAQSSVAPDLQETHIKEAYVHVRFNYRYSIM